MLCKQLAKQLFNLKFQLMFINRYNCKYMRQVRGCTPNICFSTSVGNKRRKPARGV